MNKPAVSVIIPTYNRDNLLIRSVKSILNQTNQDYEILIVDDASTDNTSEVIKPYLSEKIKYFRLEKNSGQCKARNFAIDKASGTYIGFLDSDDEWLPEKIEKQMALFKNSNDPNLAAVYCGFIEKDEVSGITSVINRDNYSGDLYNRFLKGFCPSTPTMFLVKTEILKEVNGFDENLPTFVDLDLWLRIARRGYTFDFVDEPLIVKYEHLGPQIAKNLNKRLDGLKVFLGKWGNEIKKHAGKKAYKRFKKRRIEAVVKAVLSNPPENYRKDISRSIGLMFGVRSILVKQYLKAAFIYVNGPK